MINQYRSELGLTESSFCQCGEVEDTEHYLLQCTLQEEPRDIVARNLGQIFESTLEFSYLEKNTYTRDHHPYIWDISAIEAMNSG